MFQQGAKFGRFNVLSCDIASAGYLQSRGQIGQHHAQGFLMLSDVVGEGTGHRVLQQPLVGNQAFAVDRFNLLRIEIHRHNADERKYAQDDVQNRNPGWQR